MIWSEINKSGSRSYLKKNATDGNYFIFLIVERRLGHGQGLFKDSYGRDFKILYIL
jgi:hypothetical protein